jgi:hypothetical protein
MNMRDTKDELPDADVAQDDSGKAMLIMLKKLLSLALEKSESDPPKPHETYRITTTDLSRGLHPTPFQRGLIRPCTQIYQTLIRVLKTDSLT